MGQDMFYTRSKERVFYTSKERVVYMEITSVADLERAERYKEIGYKVSNVGFDTITLTKEVV